LGILPAGRSSILGNVTLFWLIPLSVWLLGEQVSARRWAAAALGLVGVTVLMAPWEWGAASGVALGYGMLLCCSLMWSLAIIVTRRFPPASRVLELLPWCFGLAALLVAPIAFWREPQGGIGPGAWWQAVFVGAIAGPIGTWSTIEAGRRLPGAVVSLGFLMVPAIGVVVSNLWLGETLGWDVLLGGALIAVSVVVAVRG
jgi:O-acetylserine/cysteine efflux transporter